MTAVTGFYTGQYGGFVTGASTSSSACGEYWRDVYGDATVGYIPPVSGYNYVENIPKRGPYDGIFRWEEVTIQLENVQSGALLEFTVPDSYTIQITPDLGWQSTIAMFGDDPDAKANNPHLKTAGVFSILEGTLTDNGDGTVTADISGNAFANAATDGYGPHLWRAVPWADGNPGLGGYPARFEYYSDESQLDFTIDNIIKETNHPNQVITGKKSLRATISIEDENNPTVFIEQNNTAWRVWFSIDRPQVKFKIVASDSGGGIVGYHSVSIDYDSFNQYNSHIWNSIDSFALFASLARLPGETSYSLKERIVDAYNNKGGSHYTGLIRAINRELGIHRFDEALNISRATDQFGQPNVDILSVITTHTRLSLYCNSLIRDEEVKVVDTYEHLVYTDYRINSIARITTERGDLLPEKDWYVYNTPDYNCIRFADYVEGIIKITYQYYIDFNYEDYSTLVDLVDAINLAANPSGTLIAEASLADNISGIENPNRLYHTTITLDINNTEDTIGWSTIKLSSIADQEWKESFKDESLMYFGSAFYKYILELKSQTNVEWGFVVADKDIWDAVESDTYGHTHLPLVYDIKLSNWKLTAPVAIKHSFDIWDAFRMGFYYDGRLIKNTGMNKELFRSGVGFKKDCMVSLKFTSVSSKDKRINLNPYLSLPIDTIDIDDSLIQDIILDI